VSQDTWSGDKQEPLSQNKWNYVEGNPLNYLDPSGNNLIPACLATIEALAVVDGPYPFGDLAGLAACGVMATTAVITTILASGTLRDVDLNDIECQVPNYIEWLYNLPVSPEIKPDPYVKPRTIRDPIIPRFSTPEAPEKPKQKHIFYFSEVGDYPYPGRDNKEIISNLKLISDIPGINGMISQLQASSGWFSMGRKFEAERVLYYYSFRKLVETNSTSMFYDFVVENMGTIKYVEVKWTQGSLSKAVLIDVVQQARMNPSGTFLLETTWISLENKRYLIEEGGIEYQ
jgi:hypothetical protein